MADLRLHEPRHSPVDINCSACDWYNNEPEPRRSWWEHLDAARASRPEPIDMGRCWIEHSHDGTEGNCEYTYSRPEPECWCLTETATHPGGGVNPHCPQHGRASRPEPLSAEEIARYRQSVDDVTSRRGDDWTERPYWVRRLLATIDAAPGAALLGPVLDAAARTEPGADLAGLLAKRIDGWSYIPDYRAGMYEVGVKLSDLRQIVAALRGVTVSPDLVAAARKHVDAECRCNVGTHNAGCDLVWTEEELRAALRALAALPASPDHQHVWVTTFGSGPDWREHCAECPAERAALPASPTCDWCGHADHGEGCAFVYEGGITCKCSRPLPASQEDGLQEAARQVLQSWAATERPDWGKRFAASLDALRAALGDKP